MRRAMGIVGRAFGAVALSGGLALAVAAAARGAGIPADDPLAIRDAVGSGIHAYHSGDFARSYDDLTNAVEAGASDARAYYFRGLSSLKLGRTMEAEADFRLGAEREASDGSVLRVSRSLERVQGHDRLVLERHRSRARLASLAREREAVGRRYSQIEDATSEVLRRRRPDDIRPELVDPRARRAPGAAEEVPSPKPAGDKTKSPFGDDEEDPFGGDAKPEPADEPEEMEADAGPMAPEPEDEAADRDQQDEVEAAAGQ